MKRGIKNTLSMTLVTLMMFNMVACGQDTSQNQGQDQTVEESVGQEEVTEGFSPKYATDTEYKLSVAGTYSNFESLESAIDRFYEYYPNGEISYTFLDDYRNTIGPALAGT